MKILVKKKKERKEKLCKMGIFTNVILISYEIFKFKCSNLVPTFPISEIKNIIIQVYETPAI